MSTEGTETILEEGLQKLCVYNRQLSWPNMVARYFTVSRLSFAQLRVLEILKEMLTELGG